MRILHVIPSIARNRGGPSEVVQHLIPALMQEGHAVELATTDIGLSASDTLPSFPHHIFPGHRPSSLTFSPGLARWVAKRAKNYDVVHAHGFYSHTTTAAIRAAIRAGVPTALQPHGVLDAYHRGDSKQKKAAYERLLIRGAYVAADRVIVSSVRERVGAREWGFEEARIRNIPLGVDPALLRSTMERSSGHDVLFLGRVSRKKRVDLVVGAVKSLNDQGTRTSLTIAGPWEAPMAELKNQVLRLAADYPIKVLGLVDKRERFHLMERHRSFAYISDDESFGISVAEAMAMGCTVVTSAEVGLAEEAAQEGGLIVVDRCVDDVARGLLRAGSHEGAAIGLRGQAYALQHFNWTSSAKTLTREYESLARQ